VRRGCKKPSCKIDLFRDHEERKQEVKKEQIDAMRALAEKGKPMGEFWDHILEASFIIHGHVCDVYRVI
jgi:hypothetical protein